MKNQRIFIAISIVVLIALSLFIVSSKKTEIANIEGNPQNYDGKLVWIEGQLVKTDRRHAMFWYGYKLRFDGPVMAIYPTPPIPEICLSGCGQSIDDSEMGWAGPYDGLVGKHVQVLGIVSYQGEITDAPNVVVRVLMIW